MPVDIIPDSTITYASLPDGSIVNINDHVYYAPEHLGEPYYIGRVMEFGTSTKRQGLQARIAWFSRAKDILHRNSTDDRLLVGTMHSDVNPISSIRGKCHVVHKQHIPKNELDDYRRSEDNFYYSQFYDRYIQRLYDVIPTDAVQNVPIETLNVLKERYEFIIVEQGKVADLTETRRTCCVCQEWCQSTVSVKCAACQKNFHMACLNPPLSRKPTKGFAWQCAYCSRQEELNSSSSSSSSDYNPEVMNPVVASDENNLQVSSLSVSSVSQGGDISKESDDNKQTKPVIRQTRSSVRTRAAKEKQQHQQHSLSVRSTNSPSSSAKVTKTKTAASEFSSSGSIKLKISLRKKGSFKDRVLKMTNMWPFRYFGINTNPKDVLDIDDRINPKVISRVGPKYQATVPEFVSPVSDVCSIHILQSSPGSPEETNTNEKKRKFGAIAASDSAYHDPGESSSSATNKTSDTRLSPLPSTSSPTACLSQLPSVTSNKRLRKSFDKKEKPVPATNYDDSAAINPDALPKSVQEANIPIRGTDNTLTGIFRPDMIDELALDSYVNSVKALKTLPLPFHNPDMMDKALSALAEANYDPALALEAMEKVTKTDFKHLVVWSKKEKDAFERSIKEHGHDLIAAKKEVKTKSMADVVRFFYQWKKTDRYESVYSQWTKVYKPLKKFKKPVSGLHTNTLSKASEKEETFDPTIVPSSAYAISSYKCANCGTHKSDIWRRTPTDLDRKKKIFIEVLCDDCGVYWLKYVKTRPIDHKQRMLNNTSSHIDHTPTTSDVVKPVKLVESRSGSTSSSASHGGSLNDITDISDHSSSRKRKNVANRAEQKPTIKKQKVKSVKTNENEAKLDYMPCKVCNSSNPLERLYHCQGCGMTVHNDCYGIKEDEEALDWMCDPCSNKRHPVSSNNYECQLCHHGATYQQPLKRTSGYCWAHLHCAAFIPEVKFVFPAQMSPVEYVGCVSEARMNARCELCNNEGGACVSCPECKKTMHVQCAVEHNFKLAFEIVPVNKTTATTCPVIPDGLFESGDTPSTSGLMVPQVWCPNHNLSGKSIVELADRSKDDKESSLSKFIKMYKGVSRKTTPAMRRWCAAVHFTTTKNAYRPKILNPRDAALESSEMEDKILSFVCPLPPVQPPAALRQGGKKKHHVVRLCTTEGCKVQHTIAWFDDPTRPGQKICRKCYLAWKEHSS
ncbi:MAG: hypothetical protein EXX96DRAFT_318024 [Benjaminiella poitrasii]|nr:MAG: hypothetical protein EXX96DRAFT_318024 [Benjaminiella poitrasii]